VTDLCADLPFREKYRTLVHSNPDAAPEVFVRQALIRPDFTILLDAADEFGLEFLLQQWEVLQNEGSGETVRAAPITNRMLRHIVSGFKKRPI
jgi:hypothetical protein